MGKYKANAGQGRQASHNWDNKPENKYKRQVARLQEDIEKLAVMIFVDDFSKPDWTLYGTGKSKVSIAMPSKQAEWDKLEEQRTKLLARMELKRYSSQYQKELAQNTTAKEYPDLAFGHCRRAFGTLPVVTQHKYDKDLAVLTSYGQGKNGEYNPLPKTSGAMSNSQPDTSNKNAARRSAASKKRATKIKKEVEADDADVVASQNRDGSPQIKREVEGEDGEVDVPPSKKIKIKAEPHSDFDESSLSDRRGYYNIDMHVMSDTTLVASREHVNPANVASNEETYLATDKSNTQRLTSFSTSKGYHTAQLSHSDFEHDSDTTMSNAPELDSLLASNKTDGTSTFESNQAQSDSLHASNEPDGTSTSKSKEKQDPMVTESNQMDSVSEAVSKVQQNMEPAKSNFGQIQSDFGQSKSKDLNSTSKAVSKGHQSMRQAKSNEATGTKIITSKVEETSTTTDLDAEGHVSASKSNTKEVAKPAVSNMEQLLESAKSNTEEVAKPAVSNMEQLLESAKSKNEEIAKPAVSNAEQLLESAKSNAENSVDSLDSVEDRGEQWDVVENAESDTGKHVSTSNSEIISTSASSEVKGGVSLVPYYSPYSDDQVESDDGLV